MAAAIAVAPKTNGVKNNRKRSSNEAIDELMCVVNDEGDFEMDEQGVDDRKQYKVDKQAIFEQNLQFASCKKSRITTLRDAFDRKEISLDADHYVELLYGYLVNFNFIEAATVHEAFPAAIKELPEVIAVWDLVKSTEELREAYKIQTGFGTGGFGAPRGFSSPLNKGFGHAPVQQNGGWSTTNPGFGQFQQARTALGQKLFCSLEKPNGFGQPDGKLEAPNKGMQEVKEQKLVLTVDQKKLAEALKEVHRKIKSGNTIHGDYLREFKKRASLVQLKSVAGASKVEMSMLLALLGFDGLSPEAMAEVTEATKNADLVSNGTGVNMMGFKACGVDHDYGYFDL